MALSFLHLPAELRNIIYDYYAQNADAEHYISSEKMVVSLALPYTCRQVCEEMRVNVAEHALGRREMKFLEARVMNLNLNPLLNLAKEQSKTRPDLIKRVCIKIMLVLTGRWNLTKVDKGWKSFAKWYLHLTRSMLRPWFSALGYWRVVKVALPRIMGRG
jgi:hypothetical protein